MSAGDVRVEERPGTPAPAATSWRWRAAIAIALGAAAVRLALAAIIPLAPDETYYWEWSRHLAAGYFDHPPAIALLIRAGTAVFGTTPFGVRVMPVLAGLGTVLIVVWLARRLGGDRAALWAAVLSTCVPLAAAGMLLATPDAPLLVTVAAALVAAERAVSAPVRSRDALVWWAIGGVCLGAAFSSKYSSVLLPLGVLIALLVSRSLRARLAAPGPYLALGLALIVFAPALVWNARHDWISFTFQLQHGFGARRGSVLAHELSLVGGQLALASPVLFVVMVAAIVRGLRRPGAPSRFVLTVVAAVPFVFFGLTALRKSVEANWPAIAYVPTIVLVAVIAELPAWRKWVAAGCVVGGIMVAAIYVHAVHPFLPFPPHQDPMGRTYGWAALAASVDTARSEIQPSAGVRNWIAGNRYQEASELAFHLPEHPVVFSLDVHSRSNQYALWPDFRHTARAGDNLVLALAPGEGTQPPAAITALAPYFTRVRRDKLVALGRGGKVHTRLRIWLLEGWRGSWPERAGASP